MKIIVRTKEKKLRLWLPGGLLYGRQLVDITTHKGDIVKITL